MTDDTQPAATGPRLDDESEVLRRNVPRSMLHDDAPMWGAFKESSHDRMASTLRERVTPEEAAATWSGRGELAGTWPILVATATMAKLPCYDDGLQPCGCGDCGDFYPEHHASVDSRGLETRGMRERAARELQQAAIATGPLYRVESPQVE